MTYFCGPPHMHEQRQDDQIETAYSSSVPIHDIAFKTNRKRWTIEKLGERRSGRSMLMVRHDDDDDDDKKTGKCTIGFGLVWFYSTSTVVAFLMSNQFNEYKHFYVNQFSLTKVHTFNIKTSLGTEKDIDIRLTIGYRSYGNQTWPIKWNAVSSRQR